MILNKIFRVIGVSFTLIGNVFQYFFPWIIFNDWWAPQPAQTKWKLIHYQISPFIIRYRLEGDNFSNVWYYSSSMTLIGVIGLIGGIISFLGIFKNRKLQFIGGIVTLFSLIFFGMNLPGIYPSFAWGFGSALSFYGVVIIFISVLFDYKISDTNKAHVNREKMKEYWNTMKVSPPMRAMIYEGGYQPAAFMSDHERRVLWP